MRSVNKSRCNKILLFSCSTLPSESCTPSPLLSATGITLNCCLLSTVDWMCKPCGVTNACIACIGAAKLKPLLIALGNSACTNLSAFWPNWSTEKASAPAAVSTCSTLGALGAVSGLCALAAAAKNRPHSKMGKSVFLN